MIINPVCLWWAVKSDVEIGRTTYRSWESARDTHIIHCNLVTSDTCEPKKRVLVSFNLFIGCSSRTHSYG